MKRKLSQLYVHQNTCLLGHLAFLVEDTRRLCIHRADLTSAKVIPDVLSGIDLTHGVHLTVKYGDVTVDTKGIRLTRAQTASAPSVEITNVVGNILTKLKLQESSLYTLIISDPGKCSFCVCKL